MTTMPVLLEQLAFPDDCTTVGQKIRKLRSARGLGVRDLAKRSGISANTLCLIESGKSSPTVSTLQRLARGLQVPITAFFETEPVHKQVVFTPSDQRPLAAFHSAQLENLGKDLSGSAVQPFVVTLPPAAGSGPEMIVHPGHEFVYCLSGFIGYNIDQTDFRLKPGDSLVFASYIPHRWVNLSEGDSQMILVLFPTDQHDEPGRYHQE
jgi:transcriptional regulator with XRE-family HTH domain